MHIRYTDTDRQKISASLRIDGIMTFVDSGICEAKGADDGVNEAR